MKKVKKNTDKTVSIKTEKKRMDEVDGKVEKKSRILCQNSCNEKGDRDLMRLGSE